MEPQSGTYHKNSQRWHFEIGTFTMQVVGYIVLEQTAQVIKSKTGIKCYQNIPQNSDMLLKNRGMWGTEWHIPSKQPDMALRSAHTTKADEA